MQRASQSSHDHSKDCTGKRGQKTHVARREHGQRLSSSHKTRSRSSPDRKTHGTLTPDYTFHPTINPFEPLNWKQDRFTFRFPTQDSKPSVSEKRTARHISSKQKLEKYWAASVQKKVKRTSQGGPIGSLHSNGHDIGKAAILPSDSKPISPSKTNHDKSGSSANPISSSVRSSASTSAAVGRRYASYASPDVVAEEEMETSMTALYAAKEEFFRQWSQEASSRPHLFPSTQLLTADELGLSAHSQHCSGRAPITRVGEESSINMQSIRPAPLAELEDTSSVALISMDAHSSQESLHCSHAGVSKTTTAMHDSGSDSVASTHLGRERADQSKDGFIAACLPFFQKTQEESTLKRSLTKTRSDCPPFHSTDTFSPSELSEALFQEPDDVVDVGSFWCLCHGRESVLEASSDDEATTSDEAWIVLYPEDDELCAC